MTAMTKTSFQFPKLGTMLDALNQSIQTRSNVKSKAFGKSMEAGSALTSCHWNSLSDLRRHRHSRYVHHIRVVQEGANVRLSMMHFKPPKSDNKAHHIDLKSAFVHCLLIEHSATGAIEKVSFGAEQGQQDASKIAMTQTLEGSMARQFITTLSRGWIRNLLPKEEMTMIEKNTYRAAAKKLDLSALMEPTSILIERAATMHQRMMESYDNPAAARTLDQAVLHVYEKGETPLRAADLFDVDVLDVVARKAFFDRIADALGKPASKLVVDHLVQSEHDEAMSARMDFRRTPDTAMAAMA